MSKKILLSGVKPTGIAHIGNYFGAMKQFVDLQNSGDYDCHLFIADYHGLNLIQDKEEMRKLTLELAIDYLAIGLDPKKSILFKQSDISAHTELAWIFNTIVTMPYLMRAHAYKDAESKNKEINVGTFDYPVLMAADILLYNTDVVPVGQDQKQHVEYARDIALKFNHIFKSETFKLPEDLILKDVAVVPGIDGRKMSKSYGNTISLFATREEIQKAVMAIVTDSGLNTVNEPLELKSPIAIPRTKIPANILNIYKLIKKEDYIINKFINGSEKYKALKEALIDDLDEFIKPMREKRATLAKNISEVEKILAEGAVQAKAKADAKLIEIKKTIGVLK